MNREGRNVRNNKLEDSGQDEDDDRKKNKSREHLVVQLKCPPFASWAERSDSILVPLLHQGPVVPEQFEQLG